MAYVHVAHDCRIEDNVILANSVQLGGHVHIGSHVIIGGTTPVHQFCKVGDHAMIGGGFRVVQDVPPYILAAGEPLKFNGLNSLGLRRKGFSPKVRKLIKEAYQSIYQSNINVSSALRKIRDSIDTTVPEIQKIIESVNKSCKDLKIALSTSSSTSVVNRVMDIRMDIYWWNPGLRTSGWSLSVLSFSPGVTTFTIL